MSAKFSSEMMEREYLICASEADVLKYLDELSQGVKTDYFLPLSCPIPELTINKLLERNSRTIDLGLARIVSEEFIGSILKRNPNDPSILVASLSNEIAISTSLTFPPDWLNSRLKKIAGEGSEDQIQALFKNKRLPKEIFIAVLRKAGVFESVLEERYFEILSCLLDNPRIGTKPNEDICEPYDMDQHEIIQDGWGLLLRLDNSFKNAALLRSKIEKFQPVEYPRESDESFLKKVLEKWVPIKDYVPDGVGFIRQLTIKKMNESDIVKLEDLILRSKDPYQAQAFFSSVSVSKLFLRFDEFYKDYGRIFLLGLIENDELYAKCFYDKINGKKFSKAMNAFEEDEKLYEGLRLYQLFNSRLGILSDQPTYRRYITSSGDYDHAEYDSSDPYEINNEMDLYFLDEKRKRIQQEILDNDSNDSKLIKIQFDNISDMFSLLSREIQVLSMKVDMMAPK